MVGCNIKPTINSSKSILLILKSKQIKYADSGFLKQSSLNTFVELFNAGALVLDLQIKKDKICLNKICLTKARFNEKFLNRYYHDDFLENILNKRSIFKSKNIKYFDDGFTQIIKNNLFDIKYVSKNNISTFKDKKNKVFIRLKVIN